MLLLGFIVLWIATLGAVMVDGLVSALLPVFERDQLVGSVVAVWLPLL